MTRTTLPKRHQYSVSDRFLQVALRYGPINCVYDCGSRDALDGLMLQERLGAKHLSCFECNPSAIELCVENIQKYSLPNTAKLVPYAISDHEGQVQFHAIDPAKTRTPHADGNIGASSLFPADPNYTNEKYVQNSIIVRATTLDLYSGNNPPPDLLWLDLQGAEAKALDGAKSILPRVRVIHTEVSFRRMYCNQALFGDIHDRLKELFTLKYIDCGRWPAVPHVYRFIRTGPWLANAVYVRKGL